MLHNTTNKKKTVHRKHPKVTHYANSAFPNRPTPVTLTNTAYPILQHETVSVDTGRSRTIPVQTPRRNTTNFPDTNSLTATTSTARCPRCLTPGSSLPPSSAPLTNSVVSHTTGSPESLTTKVSTTNDPCTSTHMNSPSRTQSSSQQTSRIPTIRRRFLAAASATGAFELAYQPSNPLLDSPSTQPQDSSLNPCSPLLNRSTQFVDLPKRSTAHHQAPCFFQPKYNQSRVTVTKEGNFAINPGCTLNKSGPTWTISAEPQLLSTCNKTFCK